MRGRTGRVLVALAILCVSTAPALAQTPPPPPPAPPPPKAWIVVDADTRHVVDAANARQPLRPASAVKLLTALVALERLPANAPIPVSPLAAGMPARKINMKPGQVWDLEDTLHTLLLVSANDAAVALAEKVGGSLAGWAEVARRTARRLGLRDQPVLADPSGLDDEFSHRGGSLMSARDLAIVARAAMSHPELRAIVSLPEYRFTGGDGLPHVLRNHNRLLGLYAGATGVKTGYTRQAGRVLVATATRGERTMLAVVLDAVDPYGSAAGLLDRGFSTPHGATPTGDRLPDVKLDAAVDPPPEPRRAAVAPAPLGAADGDATPWEGRAGSVVVLILGGVPAVLLLRRIVRRANGQAALRAASRRSGPLPAPRRRH